MLEKKKFDFNFLLINYSIYLMSINFIIVYLLTFVFNNKYSILHFDSFNNLFVVKYMSASILLSCLLPLLFIIIKNNIGGILKFMFNNIRKIKYKMQEEVFLNYVFNIGLFIILFVLLNMLITSILFIFKISVSNFNVIISSFITLLLAIYIMKKDKMTLRNIIISVIVVIAIIILSVLTSWKTYDLTWDGNSYHKTAIGQLKDGWNPIYENIEEFNQSDKNPFKINNVYGIWNNHYAKGYWIYSANIYKITNNIESGKSILLLAGISCFLICFSYFSMKMNIIYSSILSLLIVLNPVYYTQINTFYNDGLLYIFLSLLILSLTKICDQKDNMVKPKKYFLYIIVLIILINIKFTSFVYSGIYSFAYYMYFLVEPNLRKNNLKRLTLSAIIALIIGLFVIGLSTYPKNLKVAGHIFYPLFGENKVDIMITNQPKSFQHISGLKKFFLSNFSKTDNITYFHDKTPKLKFPFTIYKDEFYHLAITDTRIGGYGILFSGILILSLIVISVGLYKIYKRNKELFWMFFIPLISTLIIIIILEESWWARYLPQLYWVPIIAIIILIKFSSNIKFRILNIILILSMFLNLSFFCERNFMLEYKSYDSISEDILNLSSLYANGKTLYFYTENFDGVMYNIKDNINDFKIINDTEKIDIENHKKAKNIYMNMVEVYVGNDFNEEKQIGGNFYD